MKRLLQRLIKPVHRRLSSFLETPTPNAEVLPESLWLANSGIPEPQHATFYDQPMAHSYEDGHDNRSPQSHHRPTVEVHPDSRYQSLTLVQSRTSAVGKLRAFFSRDAHPAKHQREQRAAPGIVDRRPRRQPEEASDLPSLHENPKVAFFRSDSRGGIVIRSLLNLGTLRELAAIRHSNSVAGIIEDDCHAEKEMSSKLSPRLDAGPFGD